MFNTTTLNTKIVNASEGIVNASLFSGKGIMIAKIICLGLD